MIGIMGSFHAQMMAWIPHLTVMNKKCLNNPQILGAPLARKCWAFPKSFWWKHLPNPWIWDCDNCELQHWIPLTCPNTAQAHPPGCSILFWNLCWKLSFFRAKWAKHKLNTQSASFWHYPAFGGCMNGFTSLARRSQKAGPCHALKPNNRIVMVYTDTAISFPCDLIPMGISHLYWNASSNFGDVLEK